MKITTRLVLVVTMILILSGCAGKLEYARPTSTPTINNSITLDKSKDEVWKTIVPALGKQFFVINNLDKESGIINISYKGDPEKYVDCGRITSQVSNLRGERIYDFPASKAYEEYEVMKNGKLFQVKRTMELEGRMNIIVEDIGPKKCKVTANTKYILTAKAEVFDVQGRSANDTQTISFNTGEQAAFAHGTTCHCTGDLEKEVLSLLLSKP